MKIKKRISVFLTIAMLLSLNALSDAFAVNGVTYLDENGALKTLTGEYTELTNESLSESGSLAAGWYTVAGEVTRNGKLFISGDVKLILKDGATLNVKGIVVKENPFTVYAQSQPVLTAAGELDETHSTTGKIVTTPSGSGYAGIGGSSSDETTGGITINGGIINAEGWNAAGIGSGGSSSSSTPAHNGGSITINGGTVKASSGMYGAGIGGGQYGNSGSITINGGTVTATGGKYYGAGIGGGQYGNGENISITGGTVSAQGNEYSAGIGGSSGDGGTISISGGTVTANGGSQAAGIGGGYGRNSGSITISGGTVTATGGTSAAGIGSGYFVSSGSTVGTVSISNATVFATGGDAAIGTGTSFSGSFGDIDISNSTVLAKGGGNSAAIGTGMLHSGSFGNISISNSTVVAKSDVGIGSGNDSAGGSSFGDISITNSTVRATSTNYNTAAIGTGSSCKGSFGRITINSGKITASGNSYSGIIGTGSSHTGSFDGITINGGTLLVYNTISGSSDGYAFSQAPTMNSSVTWDISAGTSKDSLASAKNEESTYTGNRAVRIYDGNFLPGIETIETQSDGKLSATLRLPAGEGYQLIFASYYENGSLKGIDIVSVDASSTEKQTVSTSKAFSLQNKDKVMIWNNLTELKPICEPWIVWE